MMEAEYVPEIYPKNRPWVPHQERLPHEDVTHKAADRSTYGYMLDDDEVRHPVNGINPQRRYKTRLDGRTGGRMKQR